MKRPPILFISVVLFTISCNSSYRSLKKNFAKKDSEFTVEVNTTPCFGTCPVYNLEIFSQGKAHYEGIRYTDVEGEVEISLPPSDIDSLKQLILENGFFKLDSIYDDPYISDLPSTTITVSVGEEKKKVKGRINKPKEFVAIETFLASLIKRHLSQ